MNYISYTSSCSNLSRKKETICVSKALGKFLACHGELFISHSSAPWFLLKATVCLTSIKARGARNFLDYKLSIFYDFLRSCLPDKFFVSASTGSPFRNSVRALTTISFGRFSSIFFSLFLYPPNHISIYSCLDSNSSSRFLDPATL